MQEGLNEDSRNGEMPSVTFFFNGGREVPFEAENRLMACKLPLMIYSQKCQLKN